MVKNILRFSGGSSGGSLEPPPHPQFINILWKWNNLVSVISWVILWKWNNMVSMRPELIHFHGNLRKNERKSARTPTPLDIWTPFPEMLDPPLRFSLGWNRALTLRRVNMIKSAHSSDGEIFVGGNSSIRCLIESDADLRRFSNV